ncbi:MAG: ribbon-helix-helix protein, CopG family [Deltaproteobacteria bacterium]|nr:ribbon-helix-helix protein, CopG family [Deltaproteobacteria bacterium]
MGVPSTPVRIPEASKRVLREIAARDGITMQAVLERAIEEYRRHRFLEDANAAFAALREDEAAWQEELSERRAWDATLGDGERSG